MRRLVVDASVVAKLFFEEEHSDVSARLLRRASEWIAPDLVFAEVGNVVWKRWLRKEITSEEGGVVIQELLRLPIHVYATMNLLERAVQLAVAHRLSVYDCLYVVLAVAENCTLVSADRRLVNAFAASPLARKVRWVGT